MVQVSFPGVYIQEVPSGVHTITGVSTSVAAFLGRTTSGPIDRAVRLFSLADFDRQFGSPHPASDLADSVRLFFLNGGTDCYVVRVAKDAAFAQVGLMSLAGETVLRATAKAPGVWANTVRLEVDYDTPAPDETFSLAVIQEVEGSEAVRETFPNLSMNPTSPRFAPSFVTQGSALIDLALDESMGEPKEGGSFINDLANSFAGFSQARRPLGDDPAAALNALIGAAPRRARFQISVNGSSPATIDLGTLNVANGATPAAVADALEALVNAALAGVAGAPKVTVEFVSQDDVANLLTIVSDSGDRSSVRVSRAASQDIASALLMGADQGVEIVRWSNFRPAPTATITRLGTGDTPAELTQDLNSLADLQQDAITEITIDGVDVALHVTGGFDLQTTGATDKWFKSKPAAGSPHGDNDGVREKLRIIAQAINANPAAGYTAEVWGYHLALIARKGPIDARPQSVIACNTAADNAAFNAALITNVRQYSLGTANKTGAGTFVTDQQDGSDGSAPDAAAYIGDPARQTGLHALEAVDLFNLLILPGDADVSQTVMDEVLATASPFCANHRALLLLDPPASWTDSKKRPEVVQNLSLIADVRSLVVKEYSAIFYPRLHFLSSGLLRSIGPTGAIAGLMARIDSTRGVFKAPAGLEADIRGIVGLDVNLTDLENGVLNKQGVNCIRSFPTGFVNWGARTVAGQDDLGSEWKYIPIRRLALFIEESLFRGTKWVVFEPNDEPLYAQIRLNVGAFMFDLFRQGAFQGSTPAKAFFVKCDGETTTQSDRNLGIVNIIVGFAPLKPAEFVIIKIQQIAGDLQT